MNIHYGEKKRIIKFTQLSLNIIKERNKLIIRGKIMIEELLNDELSPEEAIALQMKYQSEIKQRKKEEIQIEDVEQIQYLAGVDISFYSRNEEQMGMACAVLWNLEEKKSMKEAYAQGSLKFPYVPGLLGFRESKLISQALLNLPKKYEVVICDGHGLIHPRQFGEAVHLGIALNIPTIGVAKKPFIGYSDWKALSRKKGNKTPVWSQPPNSKTRSKTDSEQEILGYAVCLRNDSKPVFISEGYKMNIDFAIQLVLKCSGEHRIPEPTYLADRFSRQKITSL